MAGVWYFAAAVLVSASVSIASDLLRSRCEPDIRTRGVLLAGLLWPVLLIGVLQVLFIAAVFVISCRPRQENLEVGV